MGSLGLRLLPQHRTLWAKFNPSIYKVRISSATSSLPRHPAKGHTRCSLTSSCCHQGGGAELHQSALSATSQPFTQLHCLFVTPRHLSSMWQGLSSWPDTLGSPPYHEAQGKPFSSSSMRARMDRAPHPSWLSPCGAPGPDPPAGLTQRDVLPKEFHNTVLNSTPIIGLSLSARGPEESQLAAHSLKAPSTRPHPQEREREEATNSPRSSCLS